MSNPWEVLKRPFDFKDIDIKCQSVSKTKDSALAVCYFDARAAQERLDEAFTPAGWSFEVRECHLSQKAGTVSGIIGRLTVWDNDRPVVREDASEITDIEALKGAVSGAFKRCFSQLGNRSLYETDLGWQPCEKWEGKFSKWTPEARRNMEAKYRQQMGLDKAPKSEPVAPKYPGSGAYLRQLDMTANQMEAFKANCAAFGKGDDWGEVALAAQARAVTDKQLLLDKAKLARFINTGQFEEVA